MGKKTLKCEYLLWNKIMKTNITGQTNVFILKKVFLSSVTEEHN